MDGPSLHRLAAALLCCLWLAQGKISEYQLESETLSRCELLRGAAVAAVGRRDHVPQCGEDGRFRHVQCINGGEECWCVDAEGAEIPSSRQNGSAVHCLTACQFHRQQALQSGDPGLVPQCLDSGEYQPVQCDPDLGQCWCVDLDGMELYGTRQNGKPSQCPGSCAVRERRLLHGVGEPSPPQCSHDANFLPVQCKFINTTDMMVFDLLHTFNRHPELFQTFSGFRQTFPELSSYCFCADSRGRERPSTGVELRLDEVYDTAFSGLSPGPSFSKSNMYRILQRRFLAVHLAMTGRFRCPSPCESERAAGSQAGNVFVPSCDANGGFVPTQCQAGGQCWCVDSDGKEIFGTRRQGVPDCSTGPKDCPSERRQALSRLFYGPAGPFSGSNVFSVTPSNQQKEESPLAPCSPEFQELLAKSGLLQSLPESERSDVGDILAEIVQGMFPSGVLALKAIALAPNPKRLQENLFGGKFLKNAGKFNFTGSVGQRGTFDFSQVFNLLGFAQANGDFGQLADILSSDSSSVILNQEISDVFGRRVNLKNNQDLIKLVGMTLEDEKFLTTLKEAITLLKAEDSTQLGSLFRATFQSSRSGFCRSDPSHSYVPQCTENGQYEEVQCQGSECWCVDSRGLELTGSRTSGSRPRCPSLCEKERQMAIKVKASRSAGSEVFIPKCEDDGGFVARQCLGKSCFCMDRNGAKHNIETSGGALQCPTDCQASASRLLLAATRSVLSDPSSVSQLSDIYIPRCAPDGSWHQIQCDGPPEQAFEFYQQWIAVNNAGKELAPSEVLGILRAYGKSPEATSSFRGFLSEMFRAGHQKVFPALASFEAFSDLPSEVLDGDAAAVFGPSVFLNPLSLWQLLRGDSARYPGPLSDFSVPLSHFDLRQCWCVNSQGSLIPDTKAPVNQIPKCPGPCSLVAHRVAEFQQHAEGLISLSNSSHVPVALSYLLAEGVRLTPEELQQTLSSELRLSETLLSNTDVALQLAAHSTLHFYWRSRLSGGDGQRQSLLLGYQPYSPQCDAGGRWLPSQCYPSTGHCWCVDEEGSYVAGSLSSRSVQLPRCQTSCQRAHAQFLLSDWTQSASDVTSSYIPSCDEDGDFTVLQTQRADSSLAWCVSPVTGKPIQPALPGSSGELQCPSRCELQRALAERREEGLGSLPECVRSGQLFSPLQCDQADCWCVSDRGQELPHTRTPRSTGKTPTCDTPQCPLPLGDSVSQGAILCRPERADGKEMQMCEVACNHGYVNALPAGDFVCDTASKAWLTDPPHSYACQRAQVLQTVQMPSVLELSLAEGQPDCISQSSSLQASLLQDMRARGLCSLQLSVSGQPSVVSVCDELSVSVECVSERSLRAHVTFKALLSELPIRALPDLHDVDSALSGGRLLDAVVELMRTGPYESLFSSEQAVVLRSAPAFGCTQGYQLLPGSTGCVVCPEGTFSSGGVCSPCPRGFYQPLAGSGSCLSCLGGRSTTAAGASSPTHCITACQQTELRCTENGDFLSAQQDVLSGRWLCVTSAGEKLLWTSAEEPITADHCKMLEKFDVVTGSGLVLEAKDAEVLRSDVAALPLEVQLRKCVSDCAQDASCQHVAVFLEGEGSRCDLYSTSSVNVECVTSEQSKGFLGSANADTFQTLSCSVKLRDGSRPGLTALRKRGHEFTTAGQKTFERLGFRKAGSGVFQTLVFSAAGSTLSDAHRFCLDTCSRDSCCDGFILNQNVLNGGSLMCGLLSRPDMLMCAEGDWDVAGVAGSDRVCGAGVQYNKQQKRFTFNFGGQDFTITDTALPATSKNKTDYQATIIGFQRVYLWKETDMTTRPTSSCSTANVQQAARVALSNAVREGFGELESAELKVDPERVVPSQRYWLFRQQFTAQEAQLWCLKRCEEERLCHVADIRDEGSLYFECVLYPDTRVCGAYDKPLRQACSLVLPQTPLTPLQKHVSLRGSVRSFYTRVPFKKMVSYSVRTRVSLAVKPITDGFLECERRCDEDLCCRGIGYVRDTSSPAGSDVLCLTLNSLGIQTCSEEDRTSWRTQDCSPSKVQTGVYPFGWYEKPVNQWTESPRACPDFKLRTPSKPVNLENWSLLESSSLLVDSSVSMFDTVHISRDIAGDVDRVRDWCLSECEGSAGCSAVSVDDRESAVRCVLYPNTHTCAPTSAGQDCRLHIREAARHVYVRRGARQELTSVLIPGHGTLIGQAAIKQAGPDSKGVNQFMGVPYARPPIGELRFSAPQPADWSGTWSATFPRPSCLQPGDLSDSSTSEDCLYLNVFVPSSITGNASVLVFFHNSGSGLLDGSYLAAVGNIVVVTANFRVAAFGFLSAGSQGLPGNYGLQDQAAALGWVQQNIALFGGDPRRVTLGAERNGADIASLHLTSPAAASLFHQALLMGGSAFSPASVMSAGQAREQTESLARELGCSASDSRELTSCLRAAPARDINAAQTKLLAVSGPLRAWSPVVDGVVVQGDPVAALRHGQFHRAPLLLGSSAEDGVISRAKKIKDFETLEGRADSKTAFYEALSNSLGGKDANVFVKEAATWFYSLQHSPTPSGYNVFSRALENATRDLFIICPTLNLANFWAANTRSRVFMYHLPEETAQTSTDLSAPLDVQFVFGVPLDPQTRELFTTRESTLSLQMMTYVANFIKSGTPNQPLFSSALPPWPHFLPHPGGDNYKELGPELSNRKDLRRGQCSFWSDYVPALTASTDKLSCTSLVGESGSSEGPTEKPVPVVDFQPITTPSKPKSEKDAYN